MHYYLDWNGCLSNPDTGVGDPPLEDSRLYGTVYFMETNGPREPGRSLIDTVSPSPETQREIVGRRPPRPLSTRYTCQSVWVRSLEVVFETCASESTGGADRYDVRVTGCSGPLIATDTGVPLSCYLHDTPTQVETGPVEKGAD